MHKNLLQARSSRLLLQQWSFQLFWLLRFLICSELVFCLSSNWCIMSIPAASSSFYTFAAFYLLTALVSLLKRSKCFRAKAEFSHANTFRWITKGCFAESQPLGRVALTQILQKVAWLSSFRSPVISFFFCWVLARTFPFIIFEMSGILCLLLLIKTWCLLVMYLARECRMLQWKETRKEKATRAS